MHDYSVVSDITSGVFRNSAIFLKEGVFHISIMTQQFPVILATSKSKTLPAKFSAQHPGATLWEWSQERLVPVILEDVSVHLVFLPKRHSFPLISFRILRQEYYKGQISK